jgi:hypothetical protein
LLYSAGVHLFIGYSYMQFFPQVVCFFNKGTDVQERACKAVSSWKSVARFARVKSYRTSRGGFYLPVYSLRRICTYEFANYCNRSWANLSRWLQPCSCIYGHVSVFCKCFPHTFTCIQLHTVKTTLDEVTIYCLGINPYSYIISSVSAGQRRPWPPCSRGFMITHNDVAKFSRTPLDEWSARHTDLYLTTQHTQQTNIHAPSGGSRRAARDLHLRPHGHWDRH